MSYLKSFFWLITVIFYLSGCSTYKAASLPKDDANPASTRMENSIKIDSHARIHLHSGKTICGIISNVTQEYLTFYFLQSNPTVDPLEGSDLSSMTEETLAFTLIKSIEIKSKDSLSWSKTSTILLVVGVLAFFGFVVGSWLQGTFAGGFSLNMS